MGGVGQRGAERGEEPGAAAAVERVSDHDGGGGAGRGHEHEREGEERREERIADDGADHAVGAGASAEARAAWAVPASATPPAPRR